MGTPATETTLAQQVAEVVYQFRAEREEEPIYVADSALYSEATMTELERKDVWWVSRVPETSTQAKALVAEEPATWQGDRGAALGGAGGAHRRADRALDRRAER